MKDALNMNCEYQLNGIPEEATVRLFRTMDSRMVPVVVAKGTDVVQVEAQVRDAQVQVEKELEKMENPDGPHSFYMRSRLVENGYKPINGAGDPLRAPNVVLDKTEDASEYVSFSIW